LIACMALSPIDICQITSIGESRSNNLRASGRG
jgi:hypothetical protein